MDKVRVIELFAGYGSQHLALKRLKRDFPQFEYEVVAFCEIEDNAIKAYQALHGDHIPNLGDITKVNPSDVPDCDLMTWSFPCTDISSAGVQKGLSEGSDTRSSLCWDAMRIFEAKRPKYLLMENVAALVSEKFVKDFNMLQLSLQKMGYTNFVQLINAKDMGVPQNRLRIFMVSILDCRRAYYFPKPFKLERRLKDVLEQNVEERYYLSEESINRMFAANKEMEAKGYGFRFEPKQPPYDCAANALKASTSFYKREDTLIAEPQINILGQLSSSQNSRIISADGISPAVINGEKDGMPKIAEPQDNVMLGWSRAREGKGEPTYHPVKVANCVTAAKHENTQNYIVEPQPLLIPQATKEGYAVVPEGGVFDASYPDSTTRRGRVQEGGTVSPTIMASQNELLRYEGTARVMQIGNLIDDTDRDFKNPQTGRVYSSDGLSPTINTCQGGQREPKIMTGIRIRRLTERELYRLMDVSEPDIDTLLNSAISKTQHCRLAGNSIVVNVLYHIFRTMFIDTVPIAGTQTTLF